VRFEIHFKNVPPVKSTPFVTQTKYTDLFNTILKEHLQHVSVQVYVPSSGRKMPVLKTSCLWKKKALFIRFFGM